MVLDVYPEAKFTGGTKKKAPIKTIMERKREGKKSKFNPSTPGRVLCHLSMPECVFMRLWSDSIKSPEAVKLPQKSHSVLIMPLRQRLLCMNKREWMVCILPHKTIHGAKFRGDPTLEVSQKGEHLCFQGFATDESETPLWEICISTLVCL